MDKTGSTEIKARGYAHPDVLVSTEWLADNLNQPGLRIIESNEDQLLYKSGHIPGAVEVDWVKDLNDAVRRDYLQREKFEELMSRLGITPQTTIVFYGDKSNWWACYAYWVFQLFGHTNAKILDGGRAKWQQEQRPLTKDVPNYPAAVYKAPVRDDRTLRAFRDQVLEHSSQGLPLIDVRTKEEFTGERLHMENYPNEGALRGGHIPGAKSVPWARAVETETGVFKSADELRKIYCNEAGLRQTDHVIAYCRIGERSSHSWFVLRYLLGLENVRNYDGSWTEWGNSVGLPIEK